MQARSVRVIFFSIVCFSLCCNFYAMSSRVLPVLPKDSSGSTERATPVICCALYGVLFKVQPPGWLPKSLGPEKMQEELFAVLEKEEELFENKPAQEQPGESWPTVVKAWLLGEINGTSVCKYARKHISRLNIPLWVAAGQAFEPAAIDYLVPLAENVAAVRACKDAGCELVLASNWRIDCLAPFEKRSVTKEVVDLFDKEHRFISEEQKMLTSTPLFFEKIKEKFGKNRSYFYLDIQAGKESLDAAQKAGMTPISVFEKQARSEASLMVLLAEHGLLSRRS